MYGELTDRVNDNPLVHWAQPSMTTCQVPAITYITLLTIVSPYSQDYIGEIIINCVMQWHGVTQLQLK